MRFRLWEIIVFGILIVLAIAFGLLRELWSGFSYFSSGILVLLLLFFVISRILYILDLKKYYDENKQIYLAELLNNGVITKNKFDNPDEKTLKEFYRSFNKSKRFQIFLCVFVLLVVVAVILHLTNAW